MQMYVMLALREEERQLWKTPDNKNKSYFAYLEFYFHAYIVKGLDTATLS